LNRPINNEIVNVREDLYDDRGDLIISKESINSELLEDEYFDE